MVIWSCKAIETASLNNSNITRKKIRKRKRKKETSDIERIKSMYLEI